MTTAAHASVDTRLMGVIHRAILRDLDRMTRVLAQPDVPDRQRAAVAEHGLWLVDLLRRHEAVEDAALWPRVRERIPGSAAILDELERDHEALTGLLAEVEASITRWRSDPGAGAEVEVAVGLLEGVLVPHLQHEEDRAMAIVSEVLTDQDWQVYTRATAEGMSRSELASETHWAVDGADPADVDAVTGRVPGVLRWVVLLRASRRYRSDAADRWGGTLQDYGPGAAAGDRDRS